MVLDLILALSGLPGAVTPEDLEATWGAGVLGVNKSIFFCFGYVGIKKASFWQDKKSKSKAKAFKIFESK